MKILSALLYLWLITNGVSKRLSIDEVPEVVGEWVQIGQAIDGEKPNDYSGSYVSICGDGSRIAIGAPRNNNGAGHVRIFGYKGGMWHQLGSDIDGESPGDLSGRVSMSEKGDRVAIGATSNHGGDEYAGHVRVYEYTGVQWSQLGQDIDGQIYGEAFGVSVSLSADGDRVAIGAPSVHSGTVRIYDYIDGIWSQVGSDIKGAKDNDSCGWSVSLSGTGYRVAIGSFQNSDYGPKVGHVRMFDYKNGEWIQEGRPVYGETQGDQSGISVSLSYDGNRVAIGSNGKDGSNGVDSGHVRIFEYHNVTSWMNIKWNKVGTSIDGAAEGDLSGYSVSLSDDGNKVAIGAYGHDGNLNLREGDAGQVRIFEYDGRWKQVGEDIIGEKSGDQSGRSVSLSSNGERVAIGSHKHNGRGYRTGQVRVFQYATSQQPTVTLSMVPSSPPTITPSSRPSTFPTTKPTTYPTPTPTNKPSSNPSPHPSSRPSSTPTRLPTIQPSIHPSSVPSPEPSLLPSSIPSEEPRLVSRIVDIISRPFKQNNGDE